MMGMEDGEGCKMVRPRGADRLGSGFVFRDSFIGQTFGIGRRTLPALQRILGLLKVRIMTLDIPFDCIWFQERRSNSTSV